MLYGYARKNSRDKNLDRQIIELEQAGVETSNIYSDDQSDYPIYSQFLEIIKPGDVVVIKSINNIGNNYKEIQTQWKIITKDKNVDIRVLDIPLLDTTIGKDHFGTLISDLILQFLSFSAEQEGSYIRQRHSEGIAAAKAKGVKFGRPKKPLPENFEELYERYLHNESISRLAKDCPNISESTLRLRIYERQRLGKIDSAD